MGNVCRSAFPDVVVSVHIPKAAGSSLLQQFKDSLGERKILLDYEDDPVDLRSRACIEPEAYALNPIRSISPYKLVYGHFQPAKYDGLFGAFRMTFLRHPVDNVQSIFRFWSAHSRETWDSPIFHYFKDNELTLERFASIPRIRYLYTQTYFGDFDMSRFDFIGDYARYDDELFRLGGSIGIELDPAVRLNVTQSYIDEKQSELWKCDGDGQRLEEILKEDIAFYERFAGR